jgi:hypothetical protein
MGDVDTVDGYHAGNASGQIPVSNGMTNTNLLAEKAITAWELKLQTVSASTALQSDACIVEVTTSDAVTLTIPSGLPVGHQYRIKRAVSSSNGISVACSGSETIEGLTSFTVQGSKVSAVLDTGEAVIEKVSSTSWACVGGQVSGSNSNGSWVKFSNGTMECWGIISGRVVGPTTAYGYGAYTDTDTYFPAQFIDTSYSITLVVRGDSSIILTSLTSRFQSTTSCGMYYFDPYRNAGTNITNLMEKWHVIGRWK